MILHVIISYAISYTSYTISKGCKCNNTQSILEQLIITLWNISLPIQCSICSFKMLVVFEIVIIQQNIKKENVFHSSVFSRSLVPNSLQYIPQYISRTRHYLSVASHSGTHNGIGQAPWSKAEALLPRIQLSSLQLWACVLPPLQNKSVVPVLHANIYKCDDCPCQDRQRFWVPLWVYHWQEEKNLWNRIYLNHHGTEHFHWDQSWWFSARMLWSNSLSQWGHLEKVTY